eukprot:c22388_g1_i1 orf=294-1310(-)
MEEPTSPLLYEEEYRIEKRADGTEDFHCIIASCTGVFSYRTLRALNNHRASSHHLPDIPKRKRGPKKSESSRTRSRSADAIKRQVMKRAIDISKREQGCRSMARLRASRLAMAQAGGLVDNNDHMTTVIQEVDKSLESWEGGASRRRSLLERRIQMARLEWAMKGEALPLPTTEADISRVEAKDDTLCFHVDESDDAEMSEGKEFPGMLFQGATVGVAKESCPLDQPQYETGFCEQIDPTTADCVETPAVHSAEMVDIGENLCEIEVHMNGEKAFVKNVICGDKYEAKHIWHNYSVSNFVSVNQHGMKLLNGSALAQQSNELIPCFDRDKVHFDPRQF